jgi:integrase
MKNTTKGFFLSTMKTQEGHRFNPNSDYWSIKEISRQYNFDFLILNISNNCIYGLKRVFVWYLENHSLSHSANMFHGLKSLLLYLCTQSYQNISMITSIHLINYKNSLGMQNEYKLGSLSGFLKKWYTMGFKGLSEDAYAYLNETTFKGNEKGRAVSTMDSQEGPFSDIELDLIQTAVNNAYSKGEILFSDFLLIWLFMIYGSRPIQLAQLKVCDLLAPRRKDNSIEYIIKIPRAKNRMKARSEFKERIVPPSLGKVLFSYAKEIKNDFKNIIEDSNQAPLFSEKEKNRSSELAYHMSSDKVRIRIQKVINSLDIISERTGEKLHVTPTRFRRTIGTRAAAEGHGELIIAEILDHTDTQNSGVYVQATPEIIKRIDKAIALQMAPIAQAFSGVLFIDKSSAKRSDDPSSDIIDPNIDESCKAMGKCGSFGFCGLLSPLACYTCSSFQAWDDGPHEKLLLHLLEEREKLMQTTDTRIASINDKTILAVAQVVDECNRLKIKNNIKEIS